jgi:hypothetical protein
VLHVVNNYMKRSTIAVIIIVIILLVIIGLLVFDIGRRQPESYVSIMNFEECSKAGYPILESYPPQCKTPDGRTFTQAVASSTPTPSASPSVSPVASSTASTNVKVTTPQPRSTISNPVVITGTAKGWYFEASFPIKITDANGKILGQAPAQAQGDWQTPDFVPFKATISYSTSTTRTGFIVLMKDNPSGDPIRDESLSIPIFFKQ